MLATQVSNEHMSSELLRQIHIWSQIRTKKREKRTLALGLKSIWSTFCKAEDKLKQFKSDASSWNSISSIYIKHMVCFIYTKRK